MLCTSTPSYATQSQKLTHSVARCWNSPIFSIKYHKVGHISFCLKVVFLNWPRKSPNIWDTFVAKFLAKTLKIPESGHTIDPPCSQVHSKTNTCLIISVTR